jgi:membrane-bound lytic murein transglycosylase B
MKWLASGFVVALIVLAGACPIVAIAAPRLIGPPAPPPDRYADRADVKAWVADVADRDSLSVEQIMRVLGDAVPVADALRLNAPPPPPPGKVVPPPTPPNWRVYRSRNVDARVDAGLLFWTDNAETLARAEEKFGVPAEVVVAIAGVETVYGRIQGNFRVVDTLLTLGFDWPGYARRDRSEYFRSQLEELLMLTRFRPDEASDMLGSYAGAVGIGQFMPGSLRKFAVDFDGDSEIDVRASPADAIGSIANFLAEHGWKRGEPVWHDVAIDSRVLADRSVDGFVGHDLVARHNPARLREAGIECIGAASGEPLALIDLPTPNEATLYRCAAPNLFVIAQYNRSFFYAAAVESLAEALRARIATVPPARPKQP